MKSFWFISLLVLLVAGCVPVKPPHLVRDNSPATSPIGCCAPLSPTRSHLFKATFDIKKHHLTGLLMIKRMDSLPVSAGPCERVYRIVFANEIGMTFFDLELKGDRCRVVSCFGPLNKKALIKILGSDFSILAGTRPLTDEKRYRQTSTMNRVISLKAGKSALWTTLSQPGDTCYATTGRSNMFDPVIITWSSYSKGFPGKIILENPVIGMKMSLRLLER